MAGKSASEADGRDLHNRLAVLRAERGISRRQLAEAVEVNVQTIGFLERGDYGPSVELALRLAAHFALPVEAIFSLTPFSPMSEQLYSIATPPDTTRGATP
ncbi:helix-turn-helix transcriptional regulator [Herbiconiux liukaitaii]|uniref:helix-turn-helix transcriptional regulator n=1 Tax=Herbiconiux liukaitaii TaxID=3342799 RepID=UPI0035BA047B